MDIKAYYREVDEAADFLKQKVSIKPSIMVVLSGGLDDFVNGIEDSTIVSSSDVPNFPVSRAEGHSGKIIFGKLKGVPIVVLKGRYHYYEGHAPQTVVFPYFVMEKLGVKALITTNAVGGINKKFKAGDIMLVEDHINMMGINPLIGIALARSSNQFTNMTNAYDEGLREIATLAAKKLGIDIRKGVYLATSGPSYETKAEIKAYRQMGADAVGMSTVPSVLAANFLGMKVLTLSCIANLAADIHGGVMTHDEVLQTMNTLAPKVVNLLKELVIQAV